MLEVIHSVLQDYGLSIEVFNKPFTEEVRLKEDLHIMDDGVSDVIFELEEKYDMEFSENEISRTKTVGDLIKIIKKSFK